MRKLAIILFVLLQSYVYAGPVCGTHATTAESMACCIDGHQSADVAGLKNADAASCCGSCDTTKGSIVRQRQDTNVVPVLAADAFLQSTLDGAATELPVSFDFVSNHQRFRSVSPPSLFILNQSLLI